jgi:hypothetical protein
MPPFDLAKHRADEPVEQIDGLFCQIRDQVERNSDRGRMTALTFVVGDMLYRGTAGLVGELGKAALIDAMSAGASSLASPPPRPAVSGSAANQDSVHRTARRRRSSSWQRLV